VEPGNAIKVTLLFPLLDNDGEPFDRETWSWFQDELVRLSGLGFDFTELGRTEGTWRGHADRCRWIVTVVKSDEDVEEIRRFLREARVKFRQEVMYLDYHRVHFELIK
jgi:hypothetical protein